GIVANVVPARRRGEGIGYFAMMSNLAVVIGPFMGLTLLQYISYSTLFTVISSLMIIGVLFSFFVKLPETADQSPYSDIRPKRKFSIDDLVERRAISISIIGSLVAMAYASIISFLSVYADALGLAQAAGYFFIVFAIVMIISRPFFGRSFDKHGPR